MYVDESGVEQTSDQTRHFLVSGVVIHEQNLQDMYARVYKIRGSVFPTKFKNSEIHAHDIYKGHKDFFGISKSEVHESLHGLYASLLDIDFSTISIVIDKKALLCSRYSDYDVLGTAYTFLIERFDNFLHKSGEKGMLRLDRTSGKPNSLNAKDRKILDLINVIRMHGTGWQSIQHIVEGPLFLDSSESGGLQIADAIAYCTANHIKKNSDFDPYWDLICTKAQKNPRGTINGYGLYHFPKM